jgi:hypothetical protein
MNSDEYLGGMSSTRPLKALVQEDLGTILPADLILKRLMRRPFNDL